MTLLRRTGVVVVGALTVTLGCLAPPVGAVSASAGAGPSGAVSAGTVYAARPTGRVVRIAPSGAQTTVAKLPNPSVRLSTVSDDGRYLIGFTANGALRVYVFDSVTTTWRSFGVAGDGFGAPRISGGPAPRIIVPFVGGPPRHEVFDLTGRRLRAITVGYDQAAVVEGVAPGTFVIPSADGRGLVVMNAETGKPVQVLRGAPSGTRCSPVSWWSVAAVLVTCGKGGEFAAPADLLAFRLDGGTSTLTDTDRDGNTYLRGWRTSTTPLVTYLTPSGAGPFAGRLTADKLVRNQWLGVPASTQPQVRTTVGARVIFTHSESSDHTSRKAAAYDLTTRSLTPLGSVSTLAVVDPLG